MAKSSSGAVLLGLGVVAVGVLLATSGSAKAATVPKPPPTPPGKPPTRPGAYVPPGGGGSGTGGGITNYPNIGQPMPPGYQPPSSTQTVGGCAVEANFPYAADLNNLLNQAPLTTDPSSAGAMADTLIPVAQAYEADGYPLAGACLRLRAQALQSLAATTGSTSSGA